MKKHRSTLVGLIILVGLWTVWEARPQAASETHAKPDVKAGPEIFADRGLNFSHKEHSKKQKMKCTDCHGMEPAQRSMPNHQLCSLCHETDENAEDALECSYCHTRTDNSVDDLPKLLEDEVKFAHEVHREQKCSDCHPRGEMLKTRMPEDPSKSDTPQMPTCELCHPNPDAGRFAAKPAMPLCVDCHQSMDGLGLVARGERIVYSETWGQRDREKQLPMTDDTIFRIYSMSKPVTSVAAMILVEEGKVERCFGAVVG